MPWCPDSIGRGAPGFGARAHTNGLLRESPFPAFKCVVILTIFLIDIRLCSLSHRLKTRRPAFLSQIPAISLLRSVQMHAIRQPRHLLQNEMKAETQPEQRDTSSTKLSLVERPAPPVPLDRKPGLSMAPIER